MTKTEAIVTDIYDAWRRQDLDLLASYLPDDFCHIIHIPADIHPLGGTSFGKRPSLERLGLIATEFDFLSFDASDLMIHKERAGVEIPLRYRHRRTGAVLETVIANFWTFEDGWPVRLTEYHDLGRVRAFTASLAGAAGVAPGR
ncbi:nuclear transport factor 2 family protein [Methyloceanibacter sp.]|uniref:nuclear transport factor 2 family protein n=1 Tax=Methyloceanibacter sp. TaxID=1965321 RepID=UPI002D3FFAC6|nr:nuclear transport factor 2 family protein [Methyloceanibacter sp.]HZP10422.1 nuclear transport factor 2 family protein [Methyloceanibacter sp.]